MGTKSWNGHDFDVLSYLVFLPPVRLRTTIGGEPESCDVLVGFLSLRQRKDAEEELLQLRKAVADLESRSDDDRLIGQLQRKLMATKVAYR